MSISPKESTAVPRRLDRASQLILAGFLIAFAGILAFVLTLGPTSQSFACRRATGECEIAESYFFGFGARHRRVIPQADVASLRIKKPLNPAGGRAGASAIVEILFKDGTTYPTVDYIVAPWAAAKADRFNAYLRDTADPEMRLDSTAPALAALLLFGGVPSLLVGLLLLLRKARAGPPIS